MTRQYQIPGGTFVNETGARQWQIPGGHFVNETVVAAAGLVSPLLSTVAVSPVFSSPLIRAAQDEDYRK
jgi:hypothetical protein